ncbi:MAG: hypothetical protein RQ754_04895 [Desulfuromonadales bacterium]|nr:hypothetical protein [Desulfuromonadales bacterium]
MPRSAILIPLICGWQQVFEGRLLKTVLVESGFEPHRQALELLKGFQPSAVVATGYGRQLPDE